MCNDMIRDVIVASKVEIPDIGDELTEALATYYITFGYSCLTFYNQVVFSKRIGHCMNYCSLVCI